MCALEFPNDYELSMKSAKTSATEGISPVAEQTQQPNSVIKIEKSTGGVGVEVEKNGVVSPDNENSPVVTNNLETFIKNDPQLKGLLFTAGLINEKGDFIKPVQDIADAINDYLAKNENMTHLRLTDENKNDMLNYFNDYVKATADDPNTFEITDKIGFAAKLSELERKNGFTISRDDVNSADKGELQEKTETPTEDPNVSFGVLDPEFLDKTRNGYIDKYGFRQGRKMYKSWLEDNVNNGMIVEVDGNYFAKKASGFALVNPEGEDEELTQKFLEVYEKDPKSAKSALARTKYFKSMSNVKASLSAMDAQDSLNLTDALGQRPVGKIDTEYYSMIFVENSDGSISLKPKYFDENDPQWKVYCKEQEKWEKEFQNVLDADAKEGTVLTEDQLKMKHLIQNLMAYNSMTNDFIPRTKENIENLNRPYEKLTDLEKQEIRARDLKNVDVAALARTYAASQMKTVGSEENPHPEYKVDFDKMAEVLVTDRFAHEKSNVEAEFQAKLLRNPADADKILKERNEKLAKITKEEEKTQREDKADYIDLMIEGKSKREDAKTVFEKTVPHWDSDAKKAAKGDGLYHTDIGKKGREFVEGNGPLFAQKTEVQKDEGYDYSVKDKTTGEVTYYKMTGSKDDYDYTIKDESGNTIYCKFDGNEWKKYWSNKGDKVAFGRDDDFNDFFYDLDESRGTTDDLLEARGKMSDKYNKQRYIKTTSRLAKTAGLTVEKNKTAGKRALHILAGIGKGATSGVAATVFGNLANRFNGIGYAAKGMAYFNALVPYEQVVHVKQHYSGEQGYSGSVHYEGDQGYSGSVHYEGDQGYSGSVHYEGDQGYSGSVHYEGDQGYSGSVHYEGDQGYSGSVHYEGDQGYSGSVHYEGHTPYSGSVSESTTVDTPYGSFVENKDIPYSGDAYYSGEQGYSGSVHYEGDKDYSGSVHYEGDKGYSGSVHYEGDKEYSGSVHYEGDKEYSGSVHYEGDKDYSGSVHYEGDQAYEGTVGYEGDVETDVTVKGEEEVHEEKEVEVRGRKKPGLLEGWGPAAIMGGILGGLGAISTAKFKRDKVDAKSDLRQIAQQQYMLVGDEKEEPIVTTDTAKVRGGAIKITGKIAEKDESIKNTSHRMKIKQTTKTDADGNSYKVNIAEDKADYVSKAYGIPVTDKRFPELYRYIMEDINHLKKGQYGEKQYLKTDLTWYFPETIPAGIVGNENDLSYAEPDNVKTVEIKLADDKNKKITYVPGSTEAKRKGKEREINGIAYN